MIASLSGTVLKVGLDSVVVGMMLVDDRLCMNTDPNDAHG